MGGARDTGANQVADDSAALANTQAGHDAALSSADEDGLDRLSLARSMYRTIKATPAGYSTRIGLYGEWGAGKTTVLNFLSEIAHRHDDVVVHISAWRAVDADSFVSSLSEKMRDKIKALKIPVPRYQKWKQWLSRLSSGTASVSQATGQAAGKIDNDLGTLVTMGAALTGSVANLVQQRLSLDVADLEQLRVLLEAHQVIVFIDDLDRADPVILPKTLMALREYLDLPGFAFVLAFDKAIITQSLQAYSQAFASSRQAFLDKIIDFEFSLDALAHNLSTRFAAQTLAQYCAFIPLKDREAAAEWFPDNPRLTRTLARELGSLKDVALRHGPDELRWEAIILQTLLRREAPECARIVEAKLLGRGASALPMAFSQAQKSDAMALLSNAIAASGFQPESEAFGRYTRLVIKLQGLRTFDTAERIRAEMFSTRAPSFTQKELLELIARWDQSRDARHLTEALQFASEAACTDRLQAAIALMNLTLAHYDRCIQRISEQKATAQRHRCVQEAEQTARFLGGLLQADDQDALYRASTQASLCNRMLELFRSNAAREFKPDELWLRCIEGRMLLDMAVRCEDPVALFYRCKKQYEVKERGPQSMPPLVGQVYALTAPAAIADLLTLFTVTNAIHLCSFEDASSPRLEMLRSTGSMLYCAPHKQALLAVLEGDEDREQHYVRAKNALDYLSLQLDRNADLPEFFAAHPEVLSSCWRLVIGEQWLQDTHETLQWMYSRLQQRGIHVAGLPEPPGRQVETAG